MLRIAAMRERGSREEQAASKVLSMASALLHTTLKPVPRTCHC